MVIKHLKDFFLAFSLKQILNIQLTWMGIFEILDDCYKFVFYNILGFNKDKKAEYRWEKEGGKKGLCSK